MPNKKIEQIKEATGQVPASVNKLNESPIQVLKHIRTTLRSMLKEVEQTLTNSQGWDGKGLDLVQQQIEESRWKY